MKYHPFGMKKFDRVILLVRDPFDALIAEWNRLNTGDNHTGVAKTDTFSNRDKWNDYIQKELSRWLDFNSFYFDNYQPNQVHILRWTTFGLRFLSCKVDCMTYLIKLRRKKMIVGKI